jgi:RimJ/RimL family protein N-acetyltransferase
MNILTPRLILRAIEREDLTQLHAWADKPEIQYQLGGWHFPTSMRDQEQWLASLTCRSTDQRFAVQTADGVLAGTANLVSIDWKNRSAFEGLMLAPAFQGQGYGTEIVTALMAYAFDELGLVRLDTDIIEYNTASLSLHQKCGWVIEGRKRFGYFRKGRYWDKVILGVTRDEAQAKHQPGTQHDSH